MMLVLYLVSSWLVGHERVEFLVAGIFGLVSYIAVGRYLCCARRGIGGHRSSCASALEQQMISIRTGIRSLFSERRWFTGLAQYRCT